MDRASALASHAAINRVTRPPVWLATDRSSLTPSQLLFYRIIEAAQMDIELVRRAPDISSLHWVRLRDDVLTWLCAPEFGPSRPVVTLSDCCDALGWNTDATRCALMRLIDRPV